MVLLGEPSNLIFGKNWDFVPTEGGGSANPKFLSNFSKGAFVGILLQYGGGSPVPTKNHIKNHQKSRKKSPITKKMGLFNEQIRGALKLNLSKNLVFCPNQVDPPPPSP